MSMVGMFLFIIISFIVLSSFPKCIRQGAGRPGDVRLAPTEAERRHEPALPFGNSSLSAARIPFPPLMQKNTAYPDLPRISGFIPLTSFCDLLSHSHPVSVILFKAHTKQALLKLEQCVCMSFFKIGSEYCKHLFSFPSRALFHNLSLQSLDGGRHVIYLGTFSKSLSPDLRVAYLVLPKELMSKYHDIYLISNSVVPSLIQKALYNYLRSGEYENNVRSIRTFYKKKHDTILSLLDMKNINLSGTDAGLHFIMTIDTTLPQKEIIQKMLKQDIGVYPTERYWIRKQDCPSNQILIGFSSIPCDIIEAAMQKMNRIINEIAG